MKYNNKIDIKSQAYWQENDTYKTEVNDKPKYYALDMFPYPSGAGLHVGHPLGYIASDIASRYKRNKGFNVLHPMGFDAFGLPAEQYAIETGQHPATTTAANIERYTEQLHALGFSYDWDREVKTCDPAYYRWTQWIFIQMFNSWYDIKHGNARPIADLVKILEQEGNLNVKAACDADTPEVKADDWNAYSEKEQEQLLLKYRLTYLSDTQVNWCPHLGTVLSNDEVKDGYSERGGHPVVKRNMQQWNMRITAYADRLLSGLPELDWSDSLKEMQRNWIGRSEGVEFSFQVEGSELSLQVFTTRIDTVYGVTFMAVAPKSELLKSLVTPEEEEAVATYLKQASEQSERERSSLTKKSTGVFTGSYAINPFNNNRVPVWIADYVLPGYGTGAVMAVPGSDQRDEQFALIYDLPVIQVIDKPEGDGDELGTMINSGQFDGLSCAEARQRAAAFIALNGLGQIKINFKLRDAIFARQRYWGEPVPVYFKDGVPKTVSEKHLPILLPEVDEYKPTEDGRPPLGRATGFEYTPEGETVSYPLELSTMPGWAGSSWYWYRYMDPHNVEDFVNPDVQKYWGNVDLYVGGSEHATGHLLYSRFWNMVLFDLGYVDEPEPFSRLVNQGMIHGRSNFVYRVKGENTFVSKGLIEKYDVVKVHVDISLCHHDKLNLELFRQWRPDLNNAEFILEDGQYHCDWEIEKMSKSKHNVINPDEIIERYGADTLRLYEMFLGPLEQSKVWDTSGIEGVYRFIQKTLKLFFDTQGALKVGHDEPTEDELRIINKLIKKVGEDIEKLALNTAVSSLMIAVNELNALECSKMQILEKLVVVLSPFAPHLTEELWQQLGKEGSIVNASFPDYDKAYLILESYLYPIKIDGKVRAKVEFRLDAPQEEVERQVMELETVKKWLVNGLNSQVRVVPNRIISINTKLESKSV